MKKSIVKIIHEIALDECFDQLNDAWVDMGYSERFCQLIDWAYEANEKNKEELERESLKPNFANYLSRFGV